MNEYIIKRNELNVKIDSLKFYGGHDNEVIDSKFKGKVINVVDDDKPVDKPTKKSKFDM